MKQAVLDDLVEVAMAWAYPEGGEGACDDFTAVNKAAIRDDITKVLDRHKIKIVRCGTRARRGAHSQRGV